MSRMSDYRRYFVAGGTYFFTVVTDRRAGLFTDAAARRLLGSVFRRCGFRWPVRVLAIVLLRDHLHCLWALPSGDHRWVEMGHYPPDWGRSAEVNAIANVRGE
jgi:putative transposase